MLLHMCILTYWCTDILMYWHTAVLTYWCTDILLYWHTDVLTHLHTGIHWLHSPVTTKFQSKYSIHRTTRRYLLALQNLAYCVCVTATVHIRSPPRCCAWHELGASRPSERRSVSAHTAAQITVMSEQKAGAINTAPAQRAKGLSIQIMS